MTQEILTANIALSEFALQLRKYRQDNNLSFGAFAHLLDVNLERLGALELDRVAPTRREVKRFKKLLVNLQLYK